MKAETEKIIKMVEKGMIAKEIEKELGIKPKAPLRGMYYQALVEAGKIKDILTEKEVKKVAPKRKVLTISKRRTILLSKSVAYRQAWLQKRGCV